ncbi:MAG: DJ-1/PfpI family protein [Alphaproteobacteria bacterium]|nr:DJ-1/PfpI family protein [Alphaproteobacteria bacterium]
MSSLSSKNIALLLCSGFDEQPFVQLQQQLAAVGANVKVVSRDHGLTNGWAGETWGLSYPVDAALSETLAIDYDVMVIPDGQRHSDMLLNDPHGMRVVSAFLREDVPSLVIGAAVTSLKEKNLLDDRDVAGDDITLDKMLVTAPSGADTAEMISTLSKAVQAADEVEAAA